MNNNLPPSNPFMGQPMPHDKVMPQYSEDKPDMRAPISQLLKHYKDTNERKRPKQTGSSRRRRKSRRNKMRSRRRYRRS